MLEGVREVLVLVELLADERLRLALVRRDEERLRLEAEPERLALRVEHRLHLAAVELADQVAVEVGVDRRAAVSPTRTTKSAPIER